jgi:hypothetical protein
MPVVFAPDAVKQFASGSMLAIPNAMGIVVVPTHGCTTVERSDSTSGTLALAKLERRIV